MFIFDSLVGVVAGQTSGQNGSGPAGNLNKEFERAKQQREELQKRLSILQEQMHGIEGNMKTEMKGMKKDSGFWSWASGLTKSQEKGVDDDLKYLNQLRSQKAKLQGDLQRVDELIQKGELAQAAQQAEKSREEQQDRFTKAAKEAVSDVHETNEGVKSAEKFLARTETAMKYTRDGCVIAGATIATGGAAGAGYLAAAGAGTGAGTVIGAASNYGKFKMDVHYGKDETQAWDEFKSQTVQDIKTSAITGLSAGAAGKASQAILGTGAEAATASAASRIIAGRAAGGTSSAVSSLASTIEGKFISGTDDRSLGKIGWDLTVDTVTGIISGDVGARSGMASGIKGQIVARSGEVLASTAIGVGSSLLKEGEVTTETFEQNFLQSMQSEIISEMSTRVHSQHPESVGGDQKPKHRSFRLTREESPSAAPPKQTPPAPVKPESHRDVAPADTGRAVALAAVTTETSHPHSTQSRSQPHTEAPSQRQVPPEPKQGSSKPQSEITEPHTTPQTKTEASPQEHAPQSPTKSTAAPSLQESHPPLQESALPQSITSGESFNKAKEAGTKMAVSDGLPDGFRAMTTTEYDPKTKTKTAGIEVDSKLQEALKDPNHPEHQWAVKKFNEELAHSHQTPVNPKKPDGTMMTREEYLVYRAIQEGAAEDVGDRKAGSRGKDSTLANIKKLADAGHTEEALSLARKGVLTKADEKIYSEDYDANKKRIETGDGKIRQRSNAVAVAGEAFYTRIPLTSEDELSPDEFSGLKIKSKKALQNDETTTTLIHEVKAGQQLADEAGFGDKYRTYVQEKLVRLMQDEQRVSDSMAISNPHSKKLRDTIQKNIDRLQKELEEHGLKEKLQEALKGDQVKETDTGVTRVQSRGIKLLRKAEQNPRTVTPRELSSLMREFGFDERPGARGGHIAIFERDGETVSANVHNGGDKYVHVAGVEDCIDAVRQALGVNPSLAHR